MKHHLLQILSFLAAISINDPSCGKPAIRLACKNYINGGYHPLAAVGYHAKPKKTDVKFDDIEADRTINYAK